MNQKRSAVILLQASKFSATFLYGISCSVHAHAKSSSWFAQRQQQIKSFAASRVSKRSSFICHLFGQTFASTFHPSSSSFLSPLTATCGQSTVGEKKGQSNIDIPHISPFPLLLFQRHRLIIINNITIIWSSSTSSSTSSWSSYSSRLNFQLSSQLTFACVLRHISALSASLLLQLQLTTLIHQYQRP